MKEKQVFYAESYRFGRQFFIYINEKGFDAVIYDRAVDDCGDVSHEIFGSRYGFETYQEAFCFLVKNGLNQEFQDFLNFR